MSTFEFDGEKYKIASSHQKEWGKSLISQLRLKGNETVLDLGCGDGILTEQLAALVPYGKVLGIDASVGMLETARKLTSNNLKFVCMDINNINFTNEFDIIFSNAALHWVKGHEQLLKNTYQALKPNGAIFWDFGGYGNCANFISVIYKKIVGNSYKCYFQNFEWPWFMPTKLQYEKLLANSGFSVYAITEVNRDRSFSTEDKLINWIDQPSIVPFIKHIPDGLKDVFRQEVIEEMNEKTQQSDGTYFETFRRLQIYARKNNYN